jgi:glycosyltransferase involved in cell wall biosynthesis
VRVLDAPEGPQRALISWLWRWPSSRLPRRLLRRDFRAARARIPDLVAERYDAVLFCHVDAWHATRGLVRGPGVVDFDNLENLAIAGRRALGPGTDRRSSLAARWRAGLRWRVVSALDRVDERRWDRVQREAATGAGATLVCSELDVVRSGVANAVCIPNGYEFAGAEPSPREPVLAHPDAPVFLFVGRLGYEPNSDAARWFATEVLPAIRRDLPAARFRIVGRDPGSLADLAARPGVDLVGPVDDLAAELGGADVSVVPIRFGAGTRLKVVEALANRLPLVSTSVGCEGIEVVGGRDLLVADDAADFAAACVRVVVDDDLRSSLVADGYRCFDERYRWSTIRATLAEVVADVATGTTAGTATGAGSLPHGRM